MNAIVPDTALVANPIFFQAVEGSFHEACSSGDVQKVRNWIQKGVDVNKTDEFGRTPLHHAVRLGEEGRTIVEELLVAGAQINAPDKFGQTPIFFASEKTSYPYFIRYLLAAGAELEVRDRNGNTPFLNACQRESKETIYALLEVGADRMAHNNRGQNALHLFAHSPYPSYELIEYFLTNLIWPKQAELLTQQDSSGATPVHYATLREEAHWVKKMETLIKWGGRVDIPAFEEGWTVESMICDHGFVKHGYLLANKLMQRQKLVYPAAPQMQVVEEKLPEQKEECPRIWAPLYVPVALGCFVWDIVYQIRSIFTDVITAYSEKNAYRVMLDRIVITTLRDFPQSVVMRIGKIVYAAYFSLQVIGASFATIISPERGRQHVENLCTRNRENAFSYLAAKNLS